jgi:hypothetical protein
MWRASNQPGVNPGCVAQLYAAFAKLHACRA